VRGIRAEISASKRLRIGPVAPLFAAFQRLEERLVGRAAPADEAPAEGGARG
jgi:hypothetical protein